jgi:ferritin heavy chain
MSDQVRQNFHEDCEAAINRQINMELFASYTYLSMVREIFNQIEMTQFKKKPIKFQFQAYYFDRDDVALPGMHWYFKHASDEEREHAMKLLKYLNKRGGRIILQDIKNPEAQSEMTAVEAMTKALELEKEVNEVGRSAE